MALKLFRSTGYSSILSPGETRAAMHPGWMIAAVAAWVGFACNVALWREVSGHSADGAGFARALAIGVYLASGCGLVLSILGWRKTLKPAATLILFVVVLAACSIWAQGLPIDANLADKRLSSLILPSWASLLRWQVCALLVGLALVPTVWVWHTPVRRLAGPRQLNVNLTGFMIAGVLLIASGYLLWRGIV